MSARSHVTPTAARRWTLAAQVASVLLAAGAAAVVVMGLPEPAPASPAEILPTAGPGAEPTPPQTILPDTADVDWEGIVARFGQISNAPQTPTLAEPDPPETAPVAGTQDRGITDRVRYLGHIQVGRELIAMLNVDGVQRTAAQGGAVRGSDLAGRPALRVDRVEPTRALIASDHASAWVDRTDAGSLAVTTIAAPPPAPTTAAARGAPAQGIITPNARPWEQAEAAGDPLQRRLQSIDRLYEQGRIGDDRYAELRKRAVEQIERIEAGRQAGDEN